MLVTLIIGFMFVIAFLLAGRAFVEMRMDYSDNVATRLSRRRDRTLTDNRLSKHEREFALRQETAAANQRENQLPTLSSLLSRNPLLARLEDDLFQARSTIRASELIAASLFLSLIVFILLYWSGLNILAFFLAPFFLFMPWGYVKYLRARYYRMFEQQLADTLLLMANGLHAGFSFLQSLEMVSREAPQPICFEFERVVQEVSVGMPINDTLQNLAERVQSMDLNLVVTAVSIQREIGGSLAEILETIAEVINERLRTRREIRVLTTQGRMSGAILALLPIFIGILIHFSSKVSSGDSPSFVEPLLQDPRGQIMLGIAFVLQLAGFFVIMRIVSIRV
jgi:tight adherence protein B